MAAMPGRGLGASRVGRPTIGLQTIIDRLQANAPRRRKKLAAVPMPPSVEDAEQAAQVLQRSRGRGARYRDATLAGGALRPLVRGLANAAEAAASAPKGGRLRGALRGVKMQGKDVKGFTGGLTRPQLARDFVEGGLGGAALNAGREGLEVGRAKRTARSFLAGDSQKLAQGLARSISSLPKTRPIPLRPLGPLIDPEIEYEV